MKNQGFLKTIAILGATAGLSQAHAHRGGEFYQLEIDSESTLKKFEELKHQQIIQATGVTGIYVFNKELIKNSKNSEEVLSKVEAIFGNEVSIEVVGAFISEIGTNDGGWPGH